MGKAVTSQANLPVSTEKSQTINILGEGKVLTQAHAIAAWPGADVPAEVRIQYSTETLEKCARANQTQETDWRLVYTHGLSLREQRSQVGVDQNRQPCFYDNEWWLKKREDEWANFKPEPGYHLIDFNGRFGSTSWNEQEKAIAQLGGMFERAHETIVAEAVFSIFKTTKMRLLEDWYHWGVSLTSDGCRVFVGRFGRGGLGVHDCHPVWVDGSGLRVCLLRKFDP